VSWANWLNDDRKIKAVYGDETPSLSDLVFSSVNAVTDQRKVVIDIIVAAPERPPKEWVWHGYDAVSIEITFHAVSDYRMAWTGAQLGRCALNIEKAAAGGHVQLVGEGLELTLTYQFASVLKLSPFVMA
jgi:hypothetical protein